MQKENVPLQFDLFTGQAVDARTRVQKQLDRDQAKPRQTELFAQREIAQFGVRANPHFPLSEHTKLVLIREDPRTDEEVECDRLREAERLMVQLFPDRAPLPDETGEAVIKSDPPAPPVVSCRLPIVGFRVLQRRKHIQVRTRVGF